MVKVAVVQEAPVFLNREATINKAVECIGKAAQEGAKLIVFPEAFIPGYPAWIWRLKPGGDWGLCEDLHTRLLNNSVQVDSRQLEPMKEAAKKSGSTVVLGVNERDGGTLYNSVLTISHQGELVNHHRKLMPTNPERMTWGLGDAQGLKVVQTPAGRVGSLICWENYMPLARYALYSQGVELYLAPTYDSGDGWIGTMRHIAREGRCWVFCCGVALHRDDLPSDFPDRDRLYPADEGWINPGDSVIVSPGGGLVAGPMNREKGILYSDVNLDNVATAKRALDVVGHYARPDIFQLQVKTARKVATQFLEE